MFVAFSSSSTISIRVSRAREKDVQDFRPLRFFVHLHGQTGVGFVDFASFLLPQILDTIPKLNRC